MKAQIWSLDFAASLTVFLMVLLPLFFVWSYVNVQNRQEMELDEMERLALSISDALVRTGGSPGGWNSTDVKSIGLASSENVLDAAKVSEFLSMDYNKTKAVLSGGRDFYFGLRDLNGTGYGSLGNKSRGEVAIPVERYCIYDERIVKMEFALLY